MSVSKRFEKVEPGQGKLAPTQSDCPRRGMCRQPNYSRAEKPRRPHLEITGPYSFPPTRGKVGMGGESQGEGRCAPCADTVAPEGSLCANPAWSNLVIAQ